MEIPLSYLTNSYNGGYQIEFPTDVLSVPLKIGDETLLSFNETDWNNSGGSQQGPVVDSGTGGMTLPVSNEVFKEKLLEPVLKQCDDICKVKIGVLFEQANPKTGNGIEKSCAKCMLKKMKNLTVELGKRVLEVEGSTFLSEITTNCSGRYVLAWIPEPGQLFTIGTSYMMGKTL